MRKLTSDEKKNVNGGTMYYCSQHGFIGFNAFNVGWHRTFKHGGRRFTLKSI